MGESADFQKQVGMAGNSNRDHQTKVFCVGMNKTGTSTMKHCFRLLELDPISCPSERSDMMWQLVRQFYRDRNHAPIVEAAANFRSFEDRPWNMWEMYKHLDISYPDSRFILTVREPESWWRSTERWVKIKKPAMMENYMAQLNAEEFTKAELTKGYLQHNDDVIRYFEGTDKLLVMNLEEGDGWSKLCDFLNMDVPNHAFPHVNRQVYRKKDARILNQFDPAREGAQPRASSRPRGARRLLGKLAGLLRKSPDEQQDHSAR